MPTGRKLIAVRGPRVETFASVTSDEANRAEHEALRPSIRRAADGPPLDQDGVEALEFSRRGRPDDEIGYSEAAPRLTEDELATFEPARFPFTRKPR
jgi:hypothetical protein